MGEAGGEGNPVEGWGDGVGCRGGGGRKVGGVEGVGEESVLDIRGDEFLVLLLVVKAEDDAAGGFGVGGELGCGFEEAGDVGVDVGAVGEDVGEGRAREAGAERLGGLFALFVVAVFTLVYLSFGGREKLARSDLAGMSPREL